MIGDGEWIAVAFVAELKFPLVISAPELIRRKCCGELSSLSAISFSSARSDKTIAVKHGMNITHVLLNNGQLGKISKEQRAGEWDVWQTTLHNPSFAAYAELCGAQGIRVERREELEAAIAAALAHDGPSLVEVVQDAELV